MPSIDVVLHSILTVSGIFGLTVLTVGYVYLVTHLCENHPWMELASIFVPLFIIMVVYDVCMHL